MANKSVSLRILLPEATTNYIQNPSLRFDATGWTAFSSTISRVLDYARFGISSLKVITSGAVLNEGVYYRVNNLTNVSEPITVSAYVRGNGKVRIRVISNPAGAQAISKTIHLNPNRWQRIEATSFTKGSNDVRLYVESAELTAKTLTFYVDGAQMERKPYSTTYCDGDITGCRWNIMQSASLSTRDGNTRAGGRWVTLSGTDREYDDLYMTVVGGLGMAPLTNNRQSFAVAPGGFFQNSKISERIVTVTFHAKHADLFGRENDVSLVKLHELRQFLIDTIKPDLVAGNQEFLMEYRDGAKPLYFRARYDGGLEGEWDVRNKFVQTFPLRLLVVSPLFEEDDQEIISIDFQESLKLGYVAGRVDGVWNHMNFGFNNVLGDLEIGRKGEIYASGSFTVANNNVAAIDPTIPANRIAYWDGSQWRALSLSTNGAVNDVAVAPNGDIYATGAFTTIGGVAANYIAKWNGSAWSALGTGLNDHGIHISIAPNGDVYVGGRFTTAGGINARRIARWNGSSWSSLGTYGGFADNQVNSIAISQDGTYMYVGGSFTDEFGQTTDALLKIAYYDVASNTFTAVGSGFDNTVLEVIISPANILYACGDFTASGTTTCNRIAQLIGQAFAPLGSGMDDTVNSFDVGVNGDIIAVGEFTTAGGIPCRGVALWNGSVWVNLDILIAIGNPTAINPLAVQFSPNGDIYIGGIQFGQTSYQSQVSGITTVANTGSSEASPVVYVQGAGTLKWLENQTTKKRIFLNMAVLAGEEVFLDFGRGTVESTVRGNLLPFVLPGSDFNAFRLAPGDNKIACLITNDVDAVVKMSYIPSHWSMDAVA